MNKILAWEFVAQLYCTTEPYTVTVTNMASVTVMIFL